MTSRVTHNNKTKTNNTRIDDVNSDRGEEAAVLYTSIHPFKDPQSRLSSDTAFNAAKMSGVLPGSLEDQQGALLTSHIGIPLEITDSIQSWVDVQESIDEAMRESPIPKGCLSVGSSAGVRGTAASASGAATPASLARLTFLHPSSERLLQAVDSPTPSMASHGQPNSPSMVLLQSPVYIDSPGLMSIHSQSPPPEEEEDEKVEKKTVKNSLILERMVFDRVNAAAACLNSQVESGVIDSEKVIDSENEETKQRQPQSPQHEQKQGWVLGWSSRPEVTPPKEAQYAHTPSKQNKGRAHRKTNPLSLTDALLLRLEVFSAENFPVLFVSHACSVLLGAAFMLLYVKRR